MFRGTLLGVASLFIFSTVDAAPLKVDVEDAADHQVAAQGHYSGGLSHSWEWRFGSKRSAKNITGIVASGLLAAHRLSGLTEHQASALEAAKSLIVAYDRGWKARRPHTQDIEFLAAAGYVVDAGRWFGVLRRRWRPAAYVDHVIAARKRARAGSLAGWDIASAMRAALAVGQVPYAQGLLSRLVAMREAWDVPKDAMQAQVLSAASILWALGDLRPWCRLNPKEHRFADAMLRRVLAAQGPQGGFLTRDGDAYSTQTSAYAILALRRWGHKREALRARHWLRRTAVSDKLFFVGGRMWASHYSLAGRPSQDFLSEVQSEVLMALASR